MVNRPIKEQFPAGHSRQALRTGQDQKSIAQSAGTRDQKKFLFGVPGFLRGVGATLELRGVWLQQILQAKFLQSGFVKFEKSFLLTGPSRAQGLQNDAQLGRFMKALLHFARDVVPAVEMPKPNLFIGSARKSSDIPMLVERF